MTMIVASWALALAVPATTQSPVTSAAVAEADGSRSLVHVVIVDAPIADVWAAVSSADGWKRWAVPVAWTPRPDLIETSYSAAAKPGDETIIRQQVLFRAAPRLMAFRTVKAPAGFPDFDTFAKVTNLFELEALGSGRTRVRLTGAGFADTDAGRKLLAFFDQGNRRSLEALRDSFDPASSPGGPIDSALEPLAFLVGHCWRGDFVSRGQHDTHCFEPMYGGKHVRDRHEVRDATGKVTYAGETLYSWNGKTRQVEFTYLSSDGGVSRGTVAPKDGALDFGDEVYNGPDGKTIAISTVWRRAGADAYESVSRTNGGTGDRVVTYRRVN